MNTTTQQKATPKTIDVNCLEWFDKVNGNSYFAGTVTVNYGMEGEETIYLPFQYGYGDYYRDMAFKALQKAGYFPNVADIYWRAYKDNGIIARHTKHENCKKRELLAIGK